MNDKIEKIFKMNKIIFLFMTVLYYIASIIRWNIIFKISGFNKYLIDINEYHTFIVDIVFIISIWFSLSILSIYYFPYNEIIKQTKYITVTIKFTAFVVANVLFNQYSKKELIVPVIDLFLCLFLLLDILMSIKSYHKVMNKRKDYSEFLSADITDQEYSDYQSKWYTVLKHLIVISAICGIVSSNNINISLDIIIPFLGLCTLYNLYKFYSLYKKMLYKRKIYFISSIILFIAITVFLAINTYCRKVFDLNALECCVLYFSPLIVLYCSLSEINYEIIKYKYIHYPEETVLKIFLV